MASPDDVALEADGPREACLDERKSAFRDEVGGRERHLD